MCKAENSEAQNTPLRKRNHVHCNVGCLREPWQSKYLGYKAENPRDVMTGQFGKATQVFVPITGYVKSKGSFRRGNRAGKVHCEGERLSRPSTDGGWKVGASLYCSCLVRVAPGLGWELLSFGLDGFTEGLCLGQEGSIWVWWDWAKRGIGFDPGHV